LNDFLNLEQYKKRLNNKFESALIIEWDSLRKLMWTSNCIISPGKFIKTIQKLAQIKHVDIFTGYAQNDLSEFFLFLVDCFHTSLMREVNMTIVGEVENEKDKLASQCFDMIRRMYAKEYSEIFNIFYAIHVSQIVSVETGKVLSSTPEPYFMINLPIPPDDPKKMIDLYDCFNLYVEGETMEGDNGWLNEETGKKETVKKEIKFWSFPNVLAIDLKRFNSRGQKRQSFVAFPLDKLDLSRYVIGYKKKSYIYELYGIANHSGSTSGGHYTSYVKNANGKWYHFNDTSVQEVPTLEMMVSAKAYCLFYRKKM
jgi:ubiquitin carboxyl-terminal hydrolase 8